MSTTNKQYNHLEVEPKWMKFWLDNDIFKTKIKSKSKFSIALPPPNVTGELHMGHALGGTIQDVLIRFNRMLGKDVLWQIGTDHAGIGTQIVVEKFIKKSENKTKYDLGREAFILRVQDWKEEYGNKIIEQMKLLGFSPDYERVRYTMDEAYAKAVKEAFIRYFNDGLIYRGNRITNWCPHCLTSLSDLEISKEKTKKKLYKIKYQLSNGDSLIIATTRPETMFGDTAIAINPEDSRYQNLIEMIKLAPGTLQAYIPFTNRAIPLILDSSVKTDFGTGALKVTPAHDPNDYEISNRHNLDRPVIMDKHGILKHDSYVPDFVQSLDRFKARDLVVERLAESLIGIEEYEQEKDLHDRCNTEIEPYLTEQWYLKMSSLAELALEAESSQRAVFVPERYSLLFKNWLNNIQDWCISRQIWWGHQIPIYYYEENGETKYYAALEPRDSSHKQDPDVLDTWFSSALWPFVTMQDDPEIFKHFYPTDVLATAREIINLWVSRMIYSSEYFQKQEPFSKILIHPVVQTPDGKRMSKSKGNAIDPLDLIKAYGADASRMWYASVGVYGPQDVRFPGQKDKASGKWSSDQFEQYRKFANKLFNASKYLSLKIDEDKSFIPNYDFDYSDFNSADIWIWTKFNNLLKLVSKAYGDYDLATIQNSIYEFIWFDFCDWYIEFSKITESKAQKQILFYILENSLRLLHPIMPFITEELWQDLKSKYDFSKISSKISYDSSIPLSISFARYPEPNSNLQDFPELFEIELCTKIISSVRNTRQSLGISWSNSIDLIIDSDDSLREILVANQDLLIKLTKLGKISFDLSQIPKPVNISTIDLSQISKQLKIIVPLEGLVDLDKLKASLSNKIAKIKADINVLSSRLSSPNFVNNADPSKVAETRAALELAKKEEALYSLELEQFS